MAVNPIALVEEGIMNGDWEPVVQAFFLFTGTQLQVPEEQGENPLNLIKKISHEIDCFFNPVKTILANDGFDDNEYDPVYNSPSITQKQELEEEEPVDLVSARARELKDAKVNKQNPTVPEDKFKVEPKQTRNGKNYSKALPIKKGMKNTWKDDRTLAANDIAGSIKMSKIKEPEPRRDPIKYIKVTCSKCNKEEEVKPIYGPKIIEGELSSYICNSCMPKGSR